MNNNISLIVAVDENNGIGFQNKLLTHISKDLKRFKQLTQGHTVIMGRKTWESLPFKPLPGRKNIVLTRDKSINIDGAVVLNSVDEVIAEIREESKAFVIGGAEIYKLFMPVASEINLTFIHKKFEADVYFPIIDANEWHVINKETITDDEQAGVEYSFIDYVRR